MEHGLTPSAVIARLMADSVPEEPQVAIASGLLAIGSVYAGTTETCAALLLALDTRIQSGEVDAVAATARDMRKPSVRYRDSGMARTSPTIREPHGCSKSPTMRAAKPAWSRC